MSIDSEEIMAVLMTQQSAWNEGDLEAFMEGYWKSDNLSFVGKSGVTRGWKQTLDNYKKSYPDKTAMGQLSFEILSVDVLSPEIAHVIGSWHLEREGLENLGGHFSLVWRKVYGKWLIVSDHSS
ncbi:nuclear transport factor 2 family protein [Chitinophagales bacterium]|nr:nuclear transport factor 2 family protein [Chitinophagales bacterium]